MPQSYVYFKDNGFWATDAFLRDWLRLVILQLDQDKEPPEWAKEMRGDLYDQATTHMHGCMDCHLDKFMICDARKDYLLACSKHALGDIEAGLPQVASYSKEADPLLLQFSVLTNYVDWVCCIGWGFNQLLLGKFKGEGIDFKQIHSMYCKEVGRELPS